MSFIIEESWTSIEELAGAAVQVLNLKVVLIVKAVIVLKLS